MYFASSRQTVLWLLKIHCFKIFCSYQNAIAYSTLTRLEETRSDFVKAEEKQSPSAAFIHARTEYVGCVPRYQAHPINAKKFLQTAKASHNSLVKYEMKQDFQLFL